MCPFFSTYWESVYDSASSEPRVCNNPGRGKKLRRGKTPILPRGVRSCSAGCACSRACYELARSEEKHADLGATGQKDCYISAFLRHPLRFPSPRTHALKEQSLCQAESKHSLKRPYSRYLHIQFIKEQSERHRK